MHVTYLSGWVYVWFNVDTVLCMSPMNRYPLFPAHQIMRKEPITVSVAGGSNTVGNGCHNGLPWPRYLLNWLEDAFPGASISLHNGAIAATTSQYMSLCNNLHIPRESSIIILEYR